MAMSSGTSKRRGVQRRGPGLALAIEEAEPCVDERPQASLVTTIVRRATDRIAGLAAYAKVKVSVRCGGGDALRRAFAGRGRVQSSRERDRRDPSRRRRVLATYETNSGDQYWMVQDTSGRTASPEHAQSGPPRGERRRRRIMSGRCAHLDRRAWRLGSRRAIWRRNDGCSVAAPPERVRPGPRTTRRSRSGATRAHLKHLQLVPDHVSHSNG